ncbi:ParA family partition ATPase [Delftia sp. WSY_4]|jgi:chromosome partitioning protein|uniref:ParA family partition ATPase n=1 Tax=unclassified Delftia TaxID=2613839 RepID=UPI00370CFA72
MKIVAVLNEKGGTGKSTVATNLAALLHREGGGVVLIDCDPQGTSRDWRDASPKNLDLPKVLSVDDSKYLKSCLESLNADVVIIDSPAKAAEMSAAIIMESDVALIVIQPSGPDLWASGAVVKQIQEKRDLGGKIDAAFLVNRSNSSTKLHKLIRSGDWNTYDGVEVLETFIGNRTVFASAMTEGVSVFEYSDARAKNEVYNVVRELKEAKWL